MCGGDLKRVSRRPLTCEGRFLMVNRIVVFGAAALAAAGLTVIGQVGIQAFAGSDGATQSVLADCQEVDAPSDASLNCAPSVVPDESDQLTEQEVAEPGFNGGNESHNGGSSGGGSSGGGGGHR